MAITEKDAQNKWCPFSRVLAGGNYPASYNRSFGGEPTLKCLCLGSRCMAWRWDGKRMASGPMLGYCGLVGLPHEDR